MEQIIISASICTRRRLHACAVAPRRRATLGGPVSAERERVGGVRAPCGSPRGDGGRSERPRPGRSPTTMTPARGATLRVVDPLKTGLKAGYAAKTDRLDARRLADALRRDSVVSIYYPPLAIRGFRELCPARPAAGAATDAADQYPSACCCGTGSSDGRRSADERRGPLADDGGVAAGEAARCRGVGQRLAVVRHEMARIDPAVQRAQRTLIRLSPGSARSCGDWPDLALTFRAEIGDLRRFPSGRGPASYAGLVPPSTRSAGRVRDGPITRRGRRGSAGRSSKRPCTTCDGKDGWGAGAAASRSERGAESACRPGAGALR